MAVRRAAETIFRRAFESFGYREIATPTFENLELFTMKSGEGIVGELYNFKDKGDREVTLRPELTAPVMRFFVNEMSKDPRPVRVYYFGNCFRYERPQSGRYREFWQFGVESIGPETPESDAEIVGLAASTLRNLGMTDDEFRVRVGHIGVLRAFVDALALPEADRGQAFRSIDKKEWDALTSHLDANGVPAVDRDALLTIAQTAGDVDVGDAVALDAFFDAATAAVASRPECEGHLVRVRETLEHLTAYGLTTIGVDLGVARGLDYYTGLVFEIESPILGAEKQITGGGAYSLSELLGGERVGSAGFGMGFDRILLALERLGKSPVPMAGVDAYVVAIGDAARKPVFDLAQRLRDAGYRVAVDVMRRKPAKALAYASGIGARRVLLMGEKDLEEGVVTVRDMTDGAQTRVPLGEVEKAFAATGPVS